MKRLIVLFLAFVMCLSLCACGKSEAVKAAEEAIAAIGEVTIDSAEAITNAEKLYNFLTDAEKQKVGNRMTLAQAQDAYEKILNELVSENVKAAEEAIAAIGEITVNSGAAIANAEKLFELLTDAEKEKVSNRLTLVEAKEQFKKITDKLVYDNAKYAYKMLTSVEELCISGMDAIYGAWYFGIYKADDARYSNFFNEMAKNVPGLSANQLSTAAELNGYSASKAKSDWKYCLWIVQAALTQRGDFSKIHSDLKTAETTLQALTSEYGDYTYYPKLKDYYAAVKAYAEFVENPTGSFNQLKGTVNNYENNLRTLGSDVGFLFNK